MSLAVVKQVLLWMLTASFIYRACTADVDSLRRNKTNVDVKDVDNLAPHINEAIPQDLQSTWGSYKFPVRPPRLRIRKQYRNATFRNNRPTPTTTKRPTTTVLSRSKLTFPEQDAIGRRMDVIDASSSNHHPRSVIWPLRLRSGLAKRFRVPTPTTPAPQVLLKLLQPKPTRPAIYSLDGFVPKPSIQRIISTTEPPYNSFNGKTDLQQLSSNVKRRKINRYNKHEEDEDYIENETPIRRKKPISRYTAFARKGIPGQDYPMFGFIPQTEFQCREQLGAGLYADPYASCQVWHMCPGGNMAPRHSFLCPNGTIFNQKKRICDWWYNVDCKKHFRNTRSLNMFDFDIDAFETMY